MIVYKEPYSGKPGIWLALWLNLYKTQIMKDFVEKSDDTIFQIDDDGVFLLGYILECKSAVITHICDYRHRNRTGSLSHQTERHIMAKFDAPNMYIRELFEKHPRRDSLLSQLESFITYGVVSANRMMGFSIFNQLKQHIFPFINLLDGKRIALYGSGGVDQDYYSQIKKLGMCEIDMWVSKNWNTKKAPRWELLPVDRLLTGHFDYVIIAIKYKEPAETIKSELVALGVPEEKILWREPISIVSL